MGAAYMGAFVLAPLMLQRIFGFSIALTAAIMLLRTLSLTLSSPAGGVLGARIGERGSAVVGSGIMTVSLVVMAWGVSESSLLGVGAGLVLQGLGHGLGLPSLTSAISNAVPEQDLGIASATNGLTGRMGSSFGITLLMLVYGGDATPSAFGVACLTGAGLSFVSLAAALAMSRRVRHTASPLAT
jgi:MFS family permease